MLQQTFIALPVLSLAFSPVSITAGQPDYLSDAPELIAATDQSWGVLGLNSAAHAPGTAPQPLRIGSKTYTRGLGHHANGTISILLDAQYDSFEADLGLQPCQGGSVIFRILVDGRTAFESPVIRSGDEPRPIRIDLKNAHELTLQSTDAGDCISCDMANWADARLTPASNSNSDPNAARRSAPGPKVDIGRFARIVTWNPTRTNGAQASRIEEFRAEDVFTETELRPDRNGTFTIPAQASKPGCIGLQWLEQRHIGKLTLDFEDATQAPAIPAVRLDGWFGESAWQGQWQPLNGQVHAENRTLTFTPDSKSPVHTRKVRWILPADAGPAKVRLSAFSRSRWAQTNILVQCEKPNSRGKGTLSIYNGELKVRGQADGGQGTDGGGRRDKGRADITWQTSKPLRLGIIYSRPGLLSESTLLRFQLPSGNFSVAVADLLTNDCVYLPDHGLFVTRDPAPVQLADYKTRIADRKTILEEVRAMPDQTRSQAMERTHRDYQRLGPVLLSLAADNSKFVVERDGTVRFHPTPFDWSRPYHTWTATAWQLRPRFGSGANPQLTRNLEGGWLPIPLISIREGPIRYSQRTFVARLTGGPGAGFEPTPSVCVVEFTSLNEGPEPATATLNLKIVPSGNQPASFQIQPDGPRLAAKAGGRTVALIDHAPDPQPRIAAGELLLEQSLAPGQSSTTLVWLMGDGVAPDQLPTASALPELHQRTVRHWTAHLADATLVETPDPWLNDVIRSSRVHCLIAARNEAGGARLGASPAAMNYGPLESESHSVIRGMDYLGHSEFARRSLDYFIHRYNTNGFLTTGYTTFGTAWHLWTLGEHYALTKETPWLRQNAPELARVCHWIIRQTQKTKKLDPGGRPVPEFGLMPPGVLADWNAFAYHFAMNGYYAAALRETGNALRTIGHPDATLFIARSEELRKNTLRAYAWTQARAPVLPLRDGTWIPYYPSQVHSPGKLADFFPGQDGGRSWCYDVELGAHQLIPTGILRADSPQAVRMMNHMEDVQFLSDGWFDYPAAENHADWFNLGGFSKVQPYYTRNAEIYALSDDVKPFIRSYFNTLAAMLSDEVMTLWEHFHNVAAYDKTHETGYFLHQTRNLLTTERKNDLWLAPFIPTDWLSDGSHLVVSNAPTRFGKLSYELHSKINTGYVEARIDPPPNLPGQIILRLRHPKNEVIRSVTSNDRRLRTFDSEKGIIRIDPGTAPAQLKIEFAVKQPQNSDR